MAAALIFAWIIFIPLCVVCLIGCINIVRVIRMRDQERLVNLSCCCLIVGVLTAAIGYFIFSPTHSMKVSRVLMMVSGGMNAAFWLWQAFKPEDNGSIRLGWRFFGRTDAPSVNLPAQEDDPQAWPPPPKMPSI